MEWITLRMLEYKEQSRGCWHLWFAWFPVIVHRYPDGAEKKVWLRYVLRKGKLVHSWHEWYWSYIYKLR